MSCGSRSTPFRWVTPRIRVYVCSSIECVSCTVRYILWPVNTKRKLYHCKCITKLKKLGGLCSSCRWMCRCSPCGSARARSRAEWITTDPQSASLHLFGGGLHHRPPPPQLEHPQLPLTRSLDPRCLFARGCCGRARVSSAREEEVIDYVHTCEVRRNGAAFSNSPDIFFLNGLRPDFVRLAIRDKTQFAPW